ncbi:MAG: transporter substrate-binding domain-containing protein [Bacteroidota bacterium]|nr:transporter substrate-binding domain-containing protein [Bacteroidota bacterium]
MNTSSKIRKTLPLLLISLLVLSGCSKWNLFNPDSQLIEEAESLSYLTENFPPYNYGQTGSLNGVAVEVLEILFEELNIDLTPADIVLTNWHNAYERAQNEDGTVLFSMVRNDDRESLFKWVGPIAPHKEIIVARAGSGVKIITDEDLSQYTIGVISGYPSYGLLRDKGVDPGHILEYDSLDELYEALINGDIRCISYSEQANQLVLGGMGENPEDYQTAYTVQVDQLYFAFNLSVSSALIDLFQETLDDFKNDKEADGSSTIEKILNNYSVILHAEDDVTDAMVISLVDQTAAHLETDANGTIQKINNQEAPYKDNEFTTLYSFVYDIDLTIVAHATNTSIVGVNFKGKTDAAGKAFRDEILAGALENGTGWVDYIYTKPDKSGLYQKTTYFKLITGSNSQQYIVCSGRYK